MKEIIKKVKEAIRIEGESVLALRKRIGKEFENAVNAIYRCKGRIIITGIGKSGIIGEKISATFRSIGVPAFFLHPAEGIHGDIGLVNKNDVVIVVSKSGETEEVLRIMPVFKRLGVIIISIIGDLKSQLSQKSDIILDVSTKEEACPHNLAATASTTAALAMGDALAIALLYKKELTPEDFAKFHPGGNVGKKLTTTVEEVMLTGTYVPIISERDAMKDAVLEMTAKRGMTSVVNRKGKVVGIITDGDLRRLLEKTERIFEYDVKKVMTTTPKMIKKKESVSSAIKKMEDYGVTALIVVDVARKPIGVVHLHDLMRQGFV